MRQSDYRALADFRHEIRRAFLEPLSAIGIGTGGPFGAEGPIIQTGGAICFFHALKKLEGFR